MIGYQESGSPIKAGWGGSGTGLARFTSVRENGHPSKSFRLSSPLVANSKLWPLLLALPYPVPWTGRSRAAPPDSTVSSGGQVQLRRPEGFSRNCPEWKLYISTNATWRPSASRRVDPAVSCSTFVGPCTAELPEH